MKPAYQIIADGKNITDSIKTHLKELVISDSAGFENDSLEILVSKDGIELPNTGAELEVYMGYDGQQLTNLGLFIVDELEVTIQSILIRCRAANISVRSKTRKNGMKSYKSRSWVDVSLADIVRKISNEHAYEPVISVAFNVIKIPQVDQTNESDMHFLTRLAKDHAAIFKVTSGRLIFLLDSDHLKLKSAGEIKESEIAHDWRVTIKDRMKYDAVEVSYHDFETGEKQSVIYGNHIQNASAVAVDKLAQNIPDEQAAIALAAGNQILNNTANISVKKIARTFPDKLTAIAMAIGELSRLSRGNQVIRFSTAGNPNLTAELKIKLKLSDPLLNDTWLMTRVEHRMNPDGYVTSIEGETIS